MITADIKELSRLMHSNNLSRRAPHRLTKEQHLEAVRIPEIDKLIERGATNEELRRARGKARMDYKLRVRKEYFENEGSLVLDKNEDWQATFDRRIAPCRARVVNLLYESPDLDQRIRHPKLIEGIMLLCASTERRFHVVACRRCVMRTCRLHSGFGRVAASVSIVTKSPSSYQSVFSLTDSDTDDAMMLSETGKFDTADIILREDVEDVCID